MVKRDISGVAWTETNIDGIRTDNESFMENVTVSLYRTDRSEFSDNDDGITFTTDSGNVTLYKAYDVFGNQIESKTTNIMPISKISNCLMLLICSTLIL